MDTNGIDKAFLRVAKIQSFANGLPLTNATGFFYLQDDFLYLVTCRHVVINEVIDHCPDRLQLSLHSDVSDLRQRAELSIPLYVDGIPQWCQLSHGHSADVAAVLINDPQALSNHVLATFCCDDILNKDAGIPLGQNVLIVGFPLGFHDTLHNLPIVRSATIASSFAQPFKGEPYFLTDARLHRGMSGSPVIASLPGRQKHGEQMGRWWLLGIHSSALDVSDRDPGQDERLGLNTAYYASLIPEILRSHSQPGVGGHGTIGFNN
ncbi:MAG: trypsin-like peptidase domain-containing protein [Planctomycetales bacterium]|nr:trypsin-like peptidase domain-containing protein [Planctomycetales bacterium]